MRISAISSNLKQYSDFHTAIPSPIIIYVKSGIASLSVNLESISLKVDSVLWTTGASTLRIEWASADFNAYFITVDYDTFKQARPSENETFAHRYATLGNEALSNLFRNTISNINNASILQNESQDFLASSVKSLYIAIRHIENALQANEDAKQNSAANRTYHQFMALLNKHIASEHEVRFYAQSLNITPKYLNDLMQRRLQIAAKDMISTILASILRYELSNFDTSAKQLASKYNFSDQSSMGKFFKKETGMSPQNFRDSLQ